MTHQVRGYFTILISGVFIATILLSSNLIDKALKNESDEQYIRSEIKADGKLNETQIYLLFIGNLLDIVIAFVCIILAANG